MTAGRSGGVEVVWPGKFEADGARAAIPSPGLEVRTRARYPGCGAAELGDGRLILGDNLAVMDALTRTHEGAIDLLYIDPPFATGGDFSASIAAGEGDRVVRAPAYSDRWEGGIGGFLRFLDPRLRLCARLLAPHGSLYVHLDATVAHAVKLMLDELLGAASFQREIIWRIGWISGFKSRARNWIRNHDTILFYVKDPERFTFNKAYLEYPPEYRRRDGSPPRGRGIPLDDVWNAGPGDLQLRGADSLDSIQIKSFSREKTGWATQKNESLLRRIIAASSNPGDLVADFFCGSGTTLAAAASLGRRFLGCDRERLAIHLARRRLRARGVGLVVETIDAGGRAGDAWVGGACATQGGADGDAPVIEAGAGAGAGAGAEAAPASASARITWITWTARAAWTVEVRLAGDPEVPGTGALLGELRGLDRVDGWALAWAAGEASADEEAGVLMPMLERARDPRTRSLEDAAIIELGGADDPRPRVIRAIVQIVDVLGLERRWPFTLTFAADGALTSIVAGPAEVIG